MNRRNCTHARFACLTVLFLLAPAFTVAFAQEELPVAKTVDAETRIAILETVIQKLNEYYISPDVANGIAEHLRRKLSDGGYDRFAELNPFLSQLTSDLRSVSKDRHLGVWPIETALITDDSSEEERKRIITRSRYNNFGLKRIERLPGNIGYLEILDFEDPNLAGSIAVAAMNFLANSDALIFDLRRNGGGHGYMVRLIHSYLFEQPTHTGSIYSRFNDKTEQSWTMPYVPGPRMTEIPVYVLQSRRTASAAEAFGYHLRALGRAKIVGEKSRGAANPVEEFNFPELGICLAVSAYRVTNPVTGTCWEGIGVEPDIAAAADKALLVACVEAAKTLLESDSDDEIKRARRWALEMYEAELKPVSLSDDDLANYTGRYTQYCSIAYTHGVLTFERTGRLPLTLIALGNDWFAMKEMEGRIQFIRDQTGEATEIIIIYANGYSFRCKRIREVTP